jgi:hypothetical protein
MLSISATSSSKMKKKIDLFTVMNEINSSVQELGGSITERKCISLRRRPKREKLKLK